MNPYFPFIFACSLFITMLSGGFAPPRRRELPPPRLHLKPRHEPKSIEEVNRKYPPYVQLVFVNPQVRRTQEEN